MRSQILRLPTSILFAITLTLAFSSADAEAKKKKGGDEAASAEAGAEAGSEAAAVEVLTITETGLADVDSVFMPVKGIHDQLVDAETRLRNAEANIRTALGVATDAPLATALADFKTQAADMLVFEMDGTTPKLSVKPGAPENIQVGVTAIQTAFTDIQTIVTALPALKDQAMEAVNAAKGMDFASLVKGAQGIKPNQIPPLLKTAKNNVKATTQTPTRIDGTITAATSLLGTLTDTFRN